MAKSKSKFVCQECGAVYPRYQGQCYHCQSWETIVEEVEKQIIYDSLGKSNSDIFPISIQEIKYENSPRLKTEIGEFDRVTGGGIVPGSIILIGGSPGIGKSTLLLKVASRIAEKYSSQVLYITGEESLQQIKIRGERLGVKDKNLFILSEIDMDVIISVITNTNPGLIIIDSIQTMMNPQIQSAPGSVAQVRECAALFQRISKKTGIPVIIVGHITKSGAIAGPMVLEHIVDAVLFFEGEKVRDYRILRALKNRFGSTQEIGVFMMESKGLVQVDNPSEFFLSQMSADTPGTVVVPVLEGTRTLLVEVQALVTPSNFGIPARRAEGVSLNRVNLLLAVMEKRGRLLLGGSDIFINIVGGIRTDEPAVDLGIITAIASSFKDNSIASGTCVIGEVGLGGEVRSISRAEERIREAFRMGFKRVIMPKSSLPDKFIFSSMEIIGVDTISEALRKSFN